MFHLSIQKGSGRGKSLGFPTINFDVLKNPPKLAHGVYRCSLVDPQDESMGKKYLGALFYGPREMFEEMAPSFEVYVMENFSEIPHGRLISGSEWGIEVHEKIRNVKKYESEEELKEAIREDLDEILKSTVEGRNVKIRPQTRAKRVSFLSKTLNFFREHISPQNPFLLLFHRIVNFLIAFLYGFPAKNMKVIGVTGTKGKTTTVYFISKILEEAGHKVGAISSILIKIGAQETPNNEKISSFSRVRLQKILRKMKMAGCEYLVIEVTSHALAQSRIAGIPIHTAVLTNLAGDHLEYHGGFEEYRAAKMKLFSHHPKISVLPKDDPNVSYFEKLPADRKIYFTITQATEIHYGEDKTEFAFSYGNDFVKIQWQLLGQTNILNALAAAGVAQGFGISKDTVKSALEKISSIPGRYESIKCSPDQNFRIVVDYAHTVPSLEELCKFYRPLTRGKLIIVFGATGGGRDKARRPFMGETVAKYCDIVIVTDDDPYEENRMSIIEQIAKGIHNKKEGESLFKIVGRREAIQKALSLCQSGDTLLLAGKGSEKIWVVGKENIPWDEGKIVCELYRSHINGLGKS